MEEQRWKQHTRVSLGTRADLPALLGRLESEKALDELALRATSDFSVLKSLMAD